MIIKLINKKTNEEQTISDVLEYTETSIKQQAGKGVMIQFINPDEYEIKEQTEQC